MQWSLFYLYYFQINGHEEVYLQEEKKQKVVYDPLIEIINYYASKKSDTAIAKAPVSSSVEERLKHRIIDGEKQGLEDDLKLALQRYKPLDIINTLLLDGMKVVGELFGKGEMQLPFVLQSAEVMKVAVAYLEPLMEKAGSTQKGTMVLATVKGDVHDIGKNLVDIILTNNGYKVVNLGIKCPVDVMLHAAEQHKADAIGMSGLLVKSTMIMKENLEVMAERELKVPVLLGGAALTRRYVEEDLRAVYDAPLFYCEDAFSGLRVMENLMSGVKMEMKTADDNLALPATTIQEAIKRIRIVRHQWNKALEYISDENFVRPKSIGQWSVHDIIAHFIESEYFQITRLTHLVKKELSKIYLVTGDTENRMNAEAVEKYKTYPRMELMDIWNEAQAGLIQQVSSLQPEHLNIIISGVSVSEMIADSSFAHEYAHLRKVQSWIRESQKSDKTKTPVLIRRSTVATNGDIPKPPFWGSRIIDSITLNEVYPYINEIALFRGQWQFTRGKMSVAEYDVFVTEKVLPIFERWKSRSIAENLLVPKIVYGYYPCQSDGDDLIVYQDDLKTEKLRFTFPRQPDGNYYCISDFFASTDSGRMDVFGCMLVTVGLQASEFSAKLFEANNYSDYLYFHGLSVETAEALAEYWHRQIRSELGFSHHDNKEIKKLFQQKYRGSRYSFGYPACPYLEDQAKLFDLLEPERIGVSLTEEFHLVPEQSTSAIIVHHPEAKYFTVK
ncbi:B12-binding domain-containing protein [bacterium]|nr:B12-binding domain-containing protein [bacterium]